MLNFNSLDHDDKTQILSIGMIMVDIKWKMTWRNLPGNLLQRKKCTAIKQDSSNSKLVWYPSVIAVINKLPTHIIIIDDTVAVQ